MRRALIATLTLSMAAWIAAPAASAQETVKLGFNYPRTGPYFSEGLDELRAANLAISEINAQGGILGKKVELVIRDSQSKPDVAIKNVTEMIDNEHVAMVFGGAASNVAVAAGNVCEQKGVPFFGTLTYSNTTTGVDGHRHTFRECINAWMSAKLLGKYLTAHFPGKKYFYITANYTWGTTTEDSLRKFTGTTDRAANPGVLTPFPNATADDFKSALAKAEAAKPDVLVLVLFGTDMVNAIDLAAAHGLKDKMQIVVPNLTLPMAEGAGPKNMAGVIGTIPWSQEIVAKYGFARGKKFVEDFSAKYGRYPSTAGASAYTIVYEYKAAVERAKSFSATKVIKSLENHKYQLLKDEQLWRDFDHQSVQSIYVVRCNAPEVVAKDKFNLGYFDVIDSMSGKDAVQTRKEWEAERAAGGKPKSLEPLPSGE